MFFTIFFQMLSLAVIIFSGYLMGRKRDLDQHSMGQISSLINRVFNPFLLISSALSANRTSGIRNWLIVLGLALTVHLLLILISFVIAPRFSKEPDQRAMYQLMTIFGNLGYMGIPVVKGVYGEEYVFYVLAFMLAFNVFFYTFGMSVFDGGIRRETLKGMINPGTISGIAAIPIIVYDLGRFVPHFLAVSIDYLGGLTSPLAMLAVGFAVSQADLKQIFTSGKIYLFTIFRMLIVPLLFLPIIRLLPLDSTIAGICLLEIGMPIGNLVLINGQQKGVDCSDTSAGIIMSTLLSVITLPILILFL